MSVDADIRDRVAAVVHAWTDPIAERVTIDRTDSHYWRIEPSNPHASPIWVAGYAAWDLTMGFGRSSATVEFGYSSKVTAEDALAGLDDYGRSVIAGRLIEWRRGKRGSRYELTLGDGAVARGYANWFLPLRWRPATEERFSAF